MRRVLCVCALLVVTLSPSLVPAASAHAAPNPLSNAVHVLEDEAEDGFYWYDGYDLYHLYAREAYLQTADEAGVVFRFTLYGGHAPAGQADQMFIDVGATTADGPQTFTIGTQDDHNWTGDLQIFAANVTEDDPPWTGVTARMQVFASYDQLGTGPGGSIEDVWMVSRADDDVRDRSPGGVYLPHSQGQGEVPTESQRLADSITLTGPTGYVNTSTQADNGTLTVEVENAVDNGQHVTAHVGEIPGWNASIVGSASTSLPADETTTFTVNATPTPQAREPLPVEIVTDLGGHETVYVGVNGTTLTTAIEANSLDVAPSEPSPNESPGLPGLLVVALLAGLAAIRRSAT